MKQSKKTANVEELQKRITDHSDFQIIENDDDRFILQCFCDSGSERRIQLLLW
jgi:hypothetical protein